MSAVSESVADASTSALAEHFATTPAALDQLAGEIAGALALISGEGLASDGQMPAAWLLPAYSGVAPDSLREWLQNSGAGTLFGAASGAAGAPQSTAEKDRLRDEIIAALGRHSIQLRSPATAAHLHCLPLRASIVAEVVTALLNQSMDSFDQSGITTLLETSLVNDLHARCFGDNAIAPPSKSDNRGVFTSGGTQSLLGLGRDALVLLPVGPNGSADMAAAAKVHAELIAKGDLPFCFFATAGTTDRGAVDELPAVAEFCKEHGLWMHVDAAYGGGLVWSKRASMLAGIEHADSVTIDFHKMFFQPVACGSFLVRDPASFHCMRSHADYLNREDDIFPNLVDCSLATTRRFDALKLLLSFQAMGPDSYAEAIERLFAQTTLARDWALS